MAYHYDKVSESRNSCFRFFQSAAAAGRLSASLSSNKAPRGWARRKQAPPTFTGWLSGRAKCSPSCLGSAPKSKTCRAGMDWERLEKLIFSPFVTLSRSASCPRLIFAADNIFPKKSVSSSSFSWCSMTARIWRALLPESRGPSCRQSERGNKWKPRKFDFKSKYGF